MIGSHALLSGLAQLSQLMAERRDLLARTQRDLPAEVKKLRQLQRENAEVLMCKCMCTLYVCVGVWVCGCGCGCVGVFSTSCFVYMCACHHLVPSLCVCVSTQLQQKVGLLTSELQESRDKMSELSTEQQQVGSTHPGLV